MKTVTLMSKFFLVGLLFCGFVAQNRTLTSHDLLKTHTAQKTSFSTIHKSTHRKIIFSSCPNDTTGQGLLIPVDTIRVLSIMETKNEPVTARYQLKTSRLGDTVGAFRNAYKAVLPVPNALFSPLFKTPDFVFPHPEAAAYSDSLYPFKIVPIKTDQRLLGTTTFDLALISRHVLGIQAFTSPYKLIAADVNKDGSVDAADISHLRRFILRIDSTFKKSPHWVFIPKTYVMPDILPPVDSIPQAYFFNPYTPNLPNPFQFTVIKIGDVNNSYSDTTRADSVTVQARSSRTSLVLTTENRWIEQGQTYKLAIKSVNKEKFIALQGTLSLNTQGGKNGGSFDGFERLTSETLTNFNEQNINLPSKTQLVFSWNAVSDKDFEENATLLTCQFTASRNGYLSEILKINDDLAESLVYTYGTSRDNREGGDTRKIELQFSESTKDFYVFQNEPNPFVNETSVKIQINPENGKLTPLKYSVFDGIGNLLFQQTQTLTAGTHILHFNTQELGLSKAGIYFLKVETPTGIQTIKLVKFV